MSLRFAKTFAVLDPGADADAAVVQSGTSRRFASGDRGFVLLNARTSIPKFIRPTPRKPLLRLRPAVVVVPFEPQILISRLKEKPRFVPPSKAVVNGAPAPITPAQVAKGACPGCAVGVPAPEGPRLFRGQAGVIKFDPSDAPPTKRGEPAKPKRRGFLLFLLLAAIAAGAVRAGVLRSSLDRPIGRGNPGHGNPGSPDFITVRGKKRPICAKCRALKKLGFPCKRCGKG